MVRHIKHLLSIDGVMIEAMADPEAANIARHKKQFPEISQAAEFDDYKPLLKTKLDAVVIASPHTVHAQQIVDSLGRGLHVLCEKPMVTSIADARRVMRAEKKYGKVLVLAYQRHFQDTFLYIKKMIDTGEIGKLNLIQAVQCQEWAFAVGGTWRTDPALSGYGQLSDSGSHLLDIIMWTTGLKPRRIAALVDYDKFDVDINSALTVEFEGGAIGNLTIVGNAATWWEDITFNGTKGTIFYRNGVVHHKAGVDGETRVVSPAETPWFRQAACPAGHFVQVIRGEARNQSPSISGLRVVEICQTAVESAKAGGKMTNVPKTKV
jgi:predicted dehydrogenase